MIKVFKETIICQVIIEKKFLTTKYDVVIKAKATISRIVDISNVIVRFESNDKEQVTGKYYLGVHWDTVEAYNVSRWKCNSNYKVFA